MVVGKTKEKFLQLGEKEFQHRLAPHCQLEWVIVQEGKILAGKNEGTIKLKEGERILDQLSGTAGNIIALDRQGAELSSEGLAELLQKKMNQGCGEMTFIIGGALGLNEAVLNSAGHRLSLSRMTFTHEMSRLILLEQLYRAFSILKGSRYHKA